MEPNSGTGNDNCSQPENQSVTAASLEVATPLSIASVASMIDFPPSLMESRSTNTNSVPRADLNPSPEYFLTAEQMETVQRHFPDPRSLELSLMLRLADEFAKQNRDAQEQSCPHVHRRERFFVPSILTAAPPQKATPTTTSIRTQSQRKDAGTNTRRSTLSARPRRRNDVQIPGTIPNSVIEDSDFPFDNTAILSICIATGIFMTGLYLMFRR